MLSKTTCFLLAILSAIVSCDRRSERSAPLFWPPPKPEPYSWIPDEKAEKLIQDRWECASTSRVGSNSDDTRIRELILSDIREGKKKWIGEIRWLSSNEIMATAFSYESPTASADYYYVLQRHNNDWHILTRYLLGVS